MVQLRFETELWIVVPNCQIQANWRSKIEPFFPETKNKLRYGAVLKLNQIFVYIQFVENQINAPPNYCFGKVGKNTKDFRGQILPGLLNRSTANYTLNCSTSKSMHYFCEEWLSDGCFGMACGRILNQLEKRPLKIHVIRWHGYFISLLCYSTRQEFTLWEVIKIVNTNVVIHRKYEYWFDLNGQFTVQSFFAAPEMSRNQRHYQGCMAALMGGLSRVSL